MSGERYLVEFLPMPGHEPPPAVRLRRLLKHARRSCRLQALSVALVGEAPKTMNESPGGGDDGGRGMVPSSSLPARALPDGEPAP